MKIPALIVVVILILLMLASVSIPAAKAKADTPPVTIYVVPAITDQKILPEQAISDIWLSDEISIRACPGEFEPASFVVRANEDITGLQVTASDLAGPSGTIPAENVDIRVVKCWYQAGYDIADLGHKHLTPELLLKDDSLVKVEGGENYLKLTTGEYVWISGESGIPGISDVPTVTEFPVMDNTNLQPTSILTGTNKQYWITVKIPDNALAGTYTGTIQLAASATSIEAVQVDLDVLPIKLSEPNLVTSISHHSFPSSSPTIGSKKKSESQYRAELSNLLSHGVTNPASFEGWWDYDILGRMLSIRAEVGIKQDALYSYCRYYGIGNPSEPVELEALRNKVSQLVSFAESFGISEVYIYGIDEAEGDVLESQRPAWDAVHEAGGKVWVAGNNKVFEVMGDILDLFRSAGRLDSEEAAKWHSAGNQVFSYANPEGGYENPQIYRTNYGLSLWQADYDGGMTYAYQVGFGNIWNDFDHDRYRDHNMTYPTVNGVIDTIQWEGFREGVDDVRYLSTLLDTIETAKARGSDTSAAEGWLTELKGANLSTRDLNTVRAEMIDHILYLKDTVAPEITSVNISDITHHSAVISWTTDEPSTGELEYGLSAGLGNIAYSGGERLTMHTVVIGELEPDETYFFQLAAIDESGNEGRGAIANFDTLTESTPDTSAPAILDVEISEITTNSATISWLTDEPANGQVDYWKTIQTILTTTIDTSLVTNHQGILNDLEPSTKYHLRVKSSDESENMASVSGLVFTTQAVATNEPPVLTGIGEHKVIAGEALEFAVSALDPDGDELTFTAEKLPPGAVFDPSSRLLSWQTTSTQAGQHEISFSVTDGEFSDTASALITVMDTEESPAEDAPEDTADTQPTNVSGGGGGSGGTGGGGTGMTATDSQNTNPSPNKLTLEFSGSRGHQVDTSIRGAVLEEATVSAPGKGTIRIPKGTMALTREGSPVTQIMAEQISPQDVPLAAQSQIISAYEFTPSGATFDSPIEIVLSYEPNDLPMDVNEDNLAVGYFSGDQGWIELESTTDAQDHTVSAQISHFSLYGIIGAPSAAVAPPNGSGETTGADSTAIMPNQNQLPGDTQAFPRQIPTDNAIFPSQPNQNIGFAEGNSANLNTIGEINEANQISYNNGINDASPSELLQGAPASYVQGANQISTAGVAGIGLVGLTRLISGIFAEILLATAWIISRRRRLRLETVGARFLGLATARH